MIDVNVKITSCPQMMPHFIERDYTNISTRRSVAGLMPGGPYMATYYATKSLCHYLLQMHLQKNCKLLGSHLGSCALPRAGNTGSLMLQT